MTSELTDTLCTLCGLCCDGSIFDDVELSGGAEATKLEVMGLAIDIDDQPVVLQPCTALQGKRCSIYKYRPVCCRTFECRLLQNARQGIIDVDQAKEIIAQTLRHVAVMEELCRQTGEAEEHLPLKERCNECLSQPRDCNDNARRIRGELTQAMANMEILVRKAFLD